jgi:hypothetical protein
MKGGGGEAMRGNLFALILVATMGPSPVMPALERLSVLVQVYWAATSTVNMSSQGRMPISRG